ncbi:hypothetical protein MGYG_02137 [Nannizzia gypsea CBS 118893]|uniref:F-box domain-containing protein n=1 Tax=Arthroderma gypseum (strain ATCC MYA-4604 / CBS 118893) TaxID=535722 RepID=E4UPZ1_ARTGP|nr:hypothetical protein MGYG_02137 [Nannizzia gypsea CBS 118893]EFQ99125.1 hypothetical protein MGYG_02137 [Nannizzia gypsea CBS 118893]
MTAMSTKMSAEDVITYLSNPPEHLIGPVVTIKEPAKLSTLTHSGTSSLGRLDSLSLEVLHMILHYLDIRTLSRVSRVSHRGRATVESLPIYRALMKYIPDVLKALGQCRHLHFYTARMLLDLLRTECCEKCGKFGPYLFLFTGERCCNECLVFDKYFRMITFPKAESNFNLDPGELGQLASLKTIPGVYRTHMVRKSRQRLKLLHRDEVSQLVKAKEKERLRARLEEEERMRDAGLEIDRVCTLYLSSDSLDLDEEGGPKEIPEFAGTGVINLPHLKPDNTSEYGHCCKGCEWARLRYYSNRTIVDVRLLETPRYKLRSLLWRRSLRAWPKGEFLKHAEECAGAQQLLFQWYRRRRARRMI